MKKCDQEIIKNFTNEEKDIVEKTRLIKMGGHGHRKFRKDFVNRLRPFSFFFYQKVIFSIEAKNVLKCQNTLTK